MKMKGIIVELIQEAKTGEWVDDPCLRRKGLEMYSLLLMKLMTSVKISDIDEEEFSFSELYGVSEILEESGEDVLSINETLHQIHLAFGGGKDFKSEAICIVSDIMDRLDIESVQKEVAFTEIEVDREHFPETIRKEIELALKPIYTDLYLEFTTSAQWMHCELEEWEFEEFEETSCFSARSDYPILIIKAVDKLSLEYAFELLESILIREVVEIQ